MSNQKEGFKEVWHFWDGDISKDMSFISKVEKVRFSDRSYLIVDSNSAYRQKPIMWYLWGDWCESGVIAYTTGQMRREVECKKCEGLRFIEFNERAPTADCQSCNGKGYQWEYKQCSN